MPYLCSKFLNIKVMKVRTIIGILLIVAGAWKLANMWGIIENDWLWRQPWTTYVAPALLLYVGATTIVGNSATRNADPKASTLHIVASNFLGGVDVKNSSQAKRLLTSPSGRIENKKSANCVVFR